MIWLMMLTHATVGYDKMNYPTFGRSKLNEPVFSQSLIYVTKPHLVKEPFTVPERPMNFNVTKYEKFINVFSDSIFLLRNYYFYVASKENILRLTKYSCLFQ